jgi:hypothetical protein
MLTGRHVAPGEQKQKSQPRVCSPPAAASPLAASQTGQSAATGRVSRNTPPTPKPFAAQILSSKIVE